MKALKILSLILITLLSAGCGKDDDEPTPQPTTKDYLTSGKWYLQSTTYTATTPCDRKSYYSFNSDGTLVVQAFSVDAGVCTDNGLTTGTYTLSTDNKFLTVSNGTPITVEIVTISQETLGLKMTFSGGDTGILYFDKTEG